MISDHIAPLLWAIQDFHASSRPLATAQRPAPSTSPAHSPQTHLSSCCSSNLPVQLLPQDSLPQTPPLDDCVTPTFMSLRPCETPAPQGGSQDVSPPLSLSHPPHKNRSPMKAGPCPPAAQAPIRIRHIETWAGRPATGDTSREGISDPGAQLPNLTSGVNGRCSLGKLCITITWIQTGLSISNF